MQAVYFATKSFVILFSEAVHHELRGSGVTVTAHCPGANRSRMCWSTAEGRSSAANALTSPLSGRKVAKFSSLLVLDKMKAPSSVESHDSSGGQFGGLKTLRPLVIS